MRYGLLAVGDKSFPQITRGYANRRKTLLLDKLYRSAVFGHQFAYPRPREGLTQPTRRHQRQSAVPGIGRG